MRVLVTGAAGYIGWAVVHELLAQGDEVVALVHEREAPFPAGVLVHRGDVLDPSVLMAAVAQVDGVCHLAGLARARQHRGNPTRFYRVNVGGTVNVLDALAARAHSLGAPTRIVLASTGSVYGAAADAPIPEDAAVGPANPYAASKLACEQAVGWQAGTGTLAATTLRIFNAAGAAAGRADGDGSKIIPAAVAAARTASEVTVHNSGRDVRDFVHVQDIARAFVQAIHGGRPGRHAIYNLGAITASVRQVVDSVERVTGRRVAVRDAPSEGEPGRLVADTALARGDLGWAPGVRHLDHLVQEQWAASEGEQRRSTGRG